MKWIKSGIENPSKSEVIGCCGGDEKNEWPCRTDKCRTLTKGKVLRFKLLEWCKRASFSNFKEAYTINIKHITSRFMITQSK